MKDALAIHRALLEREIVHEIVRLPRPISQADELPNVLDLPPERCLATRMYGCLDAASGERFLAALVVPAGGHLPVETVRRAVGARLIRPARPDLVNSIADYCADLVCPLLLPGSVPVLIDQNAMDRLSPEDVVYTATGEPLTALGVRLADVYALSGAEPVGPSPVR